MLVSLSHEWKIEGIKSGSVALSSTTSQPAGECPARAKALYYWNHQHSPQDHQQECLFRMAPRLLLGWNGRLPLHAFSVQTMRMTHEILVQSLVCLDHRRYVEIFSCPPCGCHPQGPPEFSISQKK